MSEDSPIRRFDSMAEAIAANAVKAPDIVAEDGYQCDTCGDSWKFPADAPRGCFRMSITRTCACGTVYEVTRS